MKFLVLGSCFLFTLMVTIQTSSALDNTTLFGDTKDLERKKCDTSCSSSECSNGDSCKENKADPNNCLDGSNGGKCVDGFCCHASCVGGNNKDLEICGTDAKCLGAGKSSCKGKCCTLCTNQASCNGFCNKNCIQKKLGDHCPCNADGTCTCVCGDTQGPCPNGKKCQSGFCVKEGECAPNEKCTKIVTVDINTCSPDKDLLTTTTVTLCEPILRGIDTDSKSNYLLLEGSSF